MVMTQDGRASEDLLWVMHVRQSLGSNSDELLLVDVC